MDTLTDSRRCKMNKQAKESKKITIPAVAALLLSVKNTFIEHQARLFPFARAFFGFCLAGLLLVSCASGGLGQKRTGNLWWGSCTKISKEDCTINGHNLEKYWFNDTKSKTYGYQIPHGKHNVEIGTRWSNGFEDSTQLTLDVKEGRKYTFHTYELKEGQDPNASVVPTEECKDHSRGWSKTYYPTSTSGGKWKKDDTIAFLAYAGLAYPPLWALGFVLAYASDRQQRSPQINEAKTNPDSTANTETQSTDSIAETIAQPPDSTPDTETKPEETVVTKVSQIVEPPAPPTARPFDGCCYVWIEDADTREVVAGTRLPGAGK
jgi:hypothetical protein